MRVAMPDREESDNYLLGAAALAVAAAVGIALQRRTQQEIGNFRINFRPTVRGETV
jgi:K+-transporting ATPase A subunit